MPGFLKCQLSGLIPSIPIRYPKSFSKVDMTQDSETIFNELGASALSVRGGIMVNPVNPIEKSDRQLPHSLSQEFHGISKGGSQKQELKDKLPQLLLII